MRELATRQTIGAPATALRRYRTSRKYATIGTTAITIKADASNKNQNFRDNHKSRRWLDRKYYSFKHDRGVDLEHVEAGLSNEQTHTQLRTTACDLGMRSVARNLRRPAHALKIPSAIQWWWCFVSRVNVWCRQKEGEHFIYDSMGYFLGTGQRRLLSTLQITTTTEAVPLLTDPRLYSWWRSTRERNRKPV